MPRNGSGVYDVPAGTTATPNTTILSAAYNAFVADLIADLNAARPVTAGGTGGTSVITGWDGLAAKGTDIASASSINLTTATGPSVTITGTATIASVTLAEGSFRIVRAGGAFTWDASASLLVNGSSTTDVTAAANDLFLVRGGASSVVSVVGLGSATTAAATTSAAGIVELATAAETSAASSSALAVTPAGLAELYNNQAYLSTVVSDLYGNYLGMPRGWADAFDTEDGIDTAASTDESYDAAGDYYAPSTTSGSMISQGTGSQITNFNTQASAMFDGTTNQASNNGSIRTGSPTSAYGGKDYSSAPTAIGRVIVYGSNDQGYINGATPNVTITLYGKNGGAPSSGTDGTSLGSITFADTANESSGRTITSSDTTTEWDYVWVNLVPATGTANILLGELQIYLPDTYNNMTLISDEFAAPANVGDTIAFLDLEYSGALVAGTDFDFAMTSAGTPSYTSTGAAYELWYSSGSTKRYIVTGIDLTSQADDAVRARFRTLTNLAIRLTAWNPRWSDA
jgi:hypothetical protein